MGKTKEDELTWANVDTGDPEEMKRFRELEARRAGERIRKSVKKLQEAGIMDDDGRPSKNALPPDMEPDSDTDL